MLTLSMSNAHITSLASRDANDMILYFSAHLGQSEIYTGIIYINFYIRHHDFCLWIKHCDKYRLYLRREFSSGKTKKATSINSWFFLLDKYVFHHLGKWQERISWIYIHFSSTVQSRFSLSWLSICSPEKPKCSEFLMSTKLAIIK